MPNSVADAQQRAEALDPQRSFCVTAPAGSGKTELLIQRYLTLLARVDQPQEILAITFTRKAATEMRSRIIEALAIAAGGDEPADPHAAHTFSLARQVLAVDAGRDWQLRRNPAQLNIRTIDSFCGALTRQMPVLSRFGGPVTAVDDAEPYYREATRMLLQELDDAGPGSDDLASLLLHFDNNWGRLEQLLVDMLACRDQWLVYMGTGVDRDSAQALVERSIELVCGDALRALDSSLVPWRSRLASLWQYSRDNLGKPGVGWPGHTPADVADWQALASLLLTTRDQLRSQVTVRDGFPPGKGAAADRKAEMRALLQELADAADVLPLLVQARQLPAARPGDEHWERMMACTRLLPQLAARLLLVFQQHGVVDHTQVSLAALDALGDDEAPTELALKLDYRLQHILVDEFQDTAVNQFELVRRLTRGWAGDNAKNPGGEKTLFIVGDGMQSIYGFRDADVGLFIKAKQLGFDDLPLDPLVLRTNFRSSAALVSWVNRVFGNAFPAADDIRHGEIAFSSATAFDDSDTGDAVTLAAFGDAEAEAAWVAGRIAPHLADPECNSVAVLVRRKADLVALVPELKSRGIGWQAQEIDALGDSAVVRDLSNLCRALHNPVDRVAWLALLRAPWCGLGSADLLAVAAMADGSLWRALQDGAAPAGISADGATRLAALCDALRDIFAWRERMPLRDWLEYAWLRLAGPSCVEEEAQLEDADAFFSMLALMETNGERYAPELLEERVASLFARASSADSKLQLMTLHKAKGLEFDVVMIPNLGQPPRAESRDLLLWDEYHSLGGESCFMLAMDDQAAREEPTLYNYLYQQRKVKRRAEYTRLLYVGTTRAARQLYLSARLEPAEEGGWKPPASGSLLATIWEWVEDDFVALVEPGAATPPATVRANDTIARLAAPAAGRQVADDSDAEPNIPERSGEAFATAVGTVIHLTLERLAQAELPTALERGRFEAWWRQELAVRGVGNLERAVERVRQSVENTLGDERGRWLLSQQREQSVSELAVSCLLPDGRLGEYVIDRTFLDSGERWVVDFKSAVPDSGQSLDDFVAREAERYRPQLENYRALMAAMEDRPVRCALYFTAVPCWHELV